MDNALPGAWSWPLKEFLQESFRGAVRMRIPMIDETVTWVPPMDVYEIDSSYIVNAELPGVEACNIKMDLSNSEFTIKGERRFDAACEKESYERLELRRGRFHRTFSLPEPVDKNRIRWQLKDGILQVVIPKCGKNKNQLGCGNF